MSGISNKIFAFVLSCVITDSGGVQKEAFFNRKPCITLREETEWSELLEAGVNCLAPPGEADIVTIFHSMQDVLIDDKLLLYGDGNAGEKIVEKLPKNQVGQAMVRFMLTFPEFCKVKSKQT